MLRIHQVKIKNLERKSTSSQLLILYGKIQSYKLLIQGGENVINLVLT